MPAPWYWTAAMRLPSPDTSDAIQMPEGAVLSVQFTPPSREMKSGLVSGKARRSAWPATMTCPSELDDSECHTSEGPVAVKLVPSGAAGAGAGAGAGGLALPPCAGGLGAA